jgi:hypothetical protein
MPVNICNIISKFNGSYFMFTSPRLPITPYTEKTTSFNEKDFLKQFELI